MDRRILIKMTNSSRKIMASNHLPVVYVALYLTYLKVFYLSASEKGKGSQLVGIFSFYVCWCQDI